MPLKDGNQLARMTDATIITTLCSKNDVDELIAACKKYNFYGTIGPRCWLPYMVEALKGYDTVLLSSSGAINGADNVPIKVFGSKWNLEQGADEVENTINFSYFKSGMYKEVVEDIRAVREAIGPDVVYKCIIETAIMSEKEIRDACELLIEGGVDYIKTGTGTVGPTTLEHVKIIMDQNKGRVKVKAAGGIRTLEMIDELVDMGVARIGLGLSSAVRLVEEANKRAGK